MTSLGHHWMCFHRNFTNSFRTPSFTEHLRVTASDSNYALNWKFDQWLLLKHFSSIMKWKFSIDEDMQDIWSSKYVPFTNFNSGRDISKTFLPSSIFTWLLLRAHIFRLNCIENLTWQFNLWAEPANDIQELASQNLKLLYS